MTAIEAPLDGDARRPAATSARSGSRLLIAVAVAIAAAAMVALRLFALRSDPYGHLDWSAGLLTDEGFYIHNARNVALFGHLRTDEFNNYLLSPLLHAAQVAVFTLFGVGSLQARLISVVSSLLTIALLFAALRRAFGVRVALTGALFLGLDHTALLYSRMALMDTPAALLATAAFYALVRGTASAVARHRYAWLAACGLLVGLTVAGRSLCAFLLPVPFLALWTADGATQDRETRRQGDKETEDASSNRKSKIENRKSNIAVALPLLLALAAYAALWYWPHRAELGPMTHYYRTHQIQPHSLRHLWDNIWHALFGDFRGLAPYLFRHTPVEFGLAVLGIGYWVLGIGRRAPVTNTQYPIPSAERYLLAWLLLGWLLLAVISYSPSRYYVTTYPALAGLAALTLWRLPEVFAALAANTLPARLVRAALAAILSFHAVLALVHYHGVLPPATTAVLLYGVPAVAAAVVGKLGNWEIRKLGNTGHSPFPHFPISQFPSFPVSALLFAWLMINAAWLSGWLGHIGFTQYEMSRWLADNVPAGSVLIGDVAPGVSLDNRFEVVHVQPGLCNWRQPVEAYAGRPRYIVILDGRWKEPYWRQKYAALVAPERRVHLARVIRWEVGVYRVPDERR